MGILDNIRKVSGIVKSRVSSAIGALRGVTVSGARARRGVRFAARSTRLLTPAGLALTAASFAPEIVRAGRAAASFASRAVTRGGAFVAGRRVVSGIAGGAAAGGAAGALQSRKSGRPTDFGDPSLQSIPPQARPGSRLSVAAERARRARAAKATRRRKPSVKRRKKAPTRRVRRKRKPVRRRKKRTHSSPRHKGHKRVSFTTASGKKVSFLSNPKARHR